PQIVRVQSGNDDALAHISKPDYQLDNRFAQELRFVDADDLSAKIDLGLHLGGAGHRFGADAHIVVRDDVTGRITLIDDRFEDLHALAGNLRTAQSPDQFLALAAEHRSTNYLNPAQIAPHRIHPPIPLECF